MIKLLWRYLRGTEGTTAIEFSLIAIPFFTLIMSIFEMAIMFAAASLLEGATGNAARLIRTGQIQQATTDPGAQERMFRDAICNSAAVLVNCEDVDIEVQQLDGFGGYTSSAAQFDGDGNLSSQGFNAAGVNDVVLVRTGYRYQLMTPLIGSLLGAGESNSQYFISTIVLQVEPYEFREGA